MSFPVEEFPDRVDYIVGLRSTVEFESFCIGHGDICPSHPHDWSVQVVESWALHHLGANLSPNPMLGPTTFHCDKVIGLHDGLIDSINVQGSDGPQVDYLC